MELYRFVCEKELYEIQEKEILRLWSPKKWGVNESIMTEIFGFNTDSSKEAVFTRVKQFIESYLEIFNISKPIKSSNEMVNWDLAEDRIYYDVYTNLLIMFNLNLCSYCQCWSLNPQVSKHINLSNSDKYVARLLSEGNIEREVVILTPKGEELKGYARFFKVVYKPYGYNKAIKTILNSFKESDRKLTHLLCTLQEKHVNQKEYRLMVTLDELHFNKIGSFSSYIYQKYNKSVIGSVDDLAEALMLRANIINDFIKNQLMHKAGEDTYVTIKIPNGFITKIEKI